MFAAEQPHVCQLMLFGLVGQVVACPTLSVESTVMSASARSVSPIQRMRRSRTSSSRSCHACTRPIGHSTEPSQLDRCRSPAVEGPRPNLGPCPRSASCTVASGRPQTTDDAACALAARTGRRVIDRLRITFRWSIPSRHRSAVATACFPSDGALPGRSAARACVAEPADPAGGAGLADQAGEDGTQQRVQSVAVPDGQRR